MDFQPSSAQSAPFGIASCCRFESWGILPRLVSLESVEGWIRRRAQTSFAVSTSPSTAVAFMARFFKLGTTLPLPERNSHANTHRYQRV